MEQFTPAQLRNSISQAPSKPLRSAGTGMML